MQVYVKKLLSRLWNDDSGAVITSEYLALGSIVVLGSVGGMVAMRDASVGEMQEFGNAVGTLNQSYTIPGQYSKGVNKGGSHAIDTPSRVGGQGPSAAFASGYGDLPGLP